MEPSSSIRSHGLSKTTEFKRTGVGGGGSLPHSHWKELQNYTTQVIAYLLGLDWDKDTKSVGSGGDGWLVIISPGQDINGRHVLEDNEVPPHQGTIGLSLLDRVTENLSSSRERSND